MHTTYKPYPTCGSILIPRGDTTTQSKMSDSLLRVSQGSWSCFIYDVKNVLSILKQFFLGGVSIAWQGDMIQPRSELQL